MDKVNISSLKTEAVIGVYESEKHHPQPLVIDLELGTNFSKAFQSDNLKDVLDYDAISQQITSYVKASRFSLIETLAGEIIQLLFSYHLINEVTIKITKPNALKNSVASICCKRYKEN